MKYVYPAIFYRAIEGGYCIEFPDVSGAATQADNLYEALEMAEDALNGILVCWEDFKAGKSDLPMNNRIVEPTPIEQIKAEPDEFSTSAFVTLIKADTDAYRKILLEIEKTKADKSKNSSTDAA